MSGTQPWPLRRPDLWFCLGLVYFYVFHGHDWFASLVGAWLLAICVLVAAMVWAVCVGAIERLRKSEDS